MANIAEHHFNHRSFYLCNKIPNFQMLFIHLFLRQARSSYIAMLALNSQSSSFSCPRFGIIGMQYHTQLQNVSWHFKSYLRFLSLFSTIWNHKNYPQSLDLHLRFHLFSSRGKVSKSPSVAAGLTSILSDNCT
jgi:hypothetical protein